MFDFLFLLRSSLNVLAENIINFMTGWGKGSSYKNWTGFNEAFTIIIRIWAKIKIKIKKFTWIVPSSHVHEYNRDTIYRKLIIFPLLHLKKNRWIYRLTFISSENIEWSLPPEIITVEIKKKIKLNNNSISSDHPACTANI